MSDLMLDPNVDIRAVLVAQAKRRRAMFASFKEPPQTTRRASSAARSVRFPGFWRLEEIRQAAPTPPTPPPPLPAGYFTPERAMLDYLAKDRLADVNLKLIGLPPREANGLVSGIGIREIVRAVAKARGIGTAEIYSNRRNRESVRARQEVMWLACRHTKLSLPQIGRALGGKDHTTVLHGRRKFDELIASGADRRTVGIDQEGRLYAL